MATLVQLIKRRLLHVGKEESLADIKNSIISLEKEYHSIIETEVDLIQRLEAQATIVDGHITKLNESDILEKIQRSLELVVELRVLETAENITKLQNYQHVQVVPQIVSTCVKHITFINDSNGQDTEIFKFCRAVTDEVRAKLQSQFLAQFEEHLQKEEDGQDLEDWVQFISISRDWLLAYCLVSTLPLASSSSSPVKVLDRYRESLDELLVPLWGRFHFHLEHARDSQSRQQILWTFQYGIHFARLLMDLCASMHQSGQLQVVAAADYSAAADAHIVDKVTRFMRAHIAQVLVRCADQQDQSGFAQTLLLLVEAALEFDHQIARQHAELFLNAVFLDSATTATLWLQKDTEYFHTAMRASCSVYKLTYSFKFERGSQRCFHGVHSSTALLTAAAHRYKYMSPSNRDRFSFMILEPLLLCGMSLFLFRLRADPLLQSITEERRHDPMTLDDATGLPAQLSELLDSSRYYRACMEVSLREVSFASGRMSGRWKTLVPWIKSAAYSNLQPRDLVDKIFDTFDDALANYTPFDRDAATSDVAYALAQVDALSSEAEKMFRAVITSTIYRSNSS